MHVALFALATQLEIFWASLIVQSVWLFSIRSLQTAIEKVQSMYVLTTTN